MVRAVCGAAAPPLFRGLRRPPGAPPPLLSPSLPPRPPPPISPRPPRLTLQTRHPADEVIRQTSVNSAERGTLLLRVRNAIRMRVAAYQTLYESSIAYGMRKALLAEQKRGELQAKILLCSAELGDLEKTALAIEEKIASMEATEKERGAAEEEKHAAEVAKLQAGNTTLKEELEMLLAPPRK